MIENSSLVQILFTGMTNGYASKTPLTSLTPQWQMFNLLLTTKGALHAMGGSVESHLGKHLQSQLILDLNIF